MMAFPVFIHFFYKDNCNIKIPYRIRILVLVYRYVNYQAILTYMFANWISAELCCKLKLQLALFKMPRICILFFSLLNNYFSLNTKLAVSALNYITWRQSVVKVEATSTYLPK